MRSKRISDFSSLACSGLQSWRVLTLTITCVALWIVVGCTSRSTLAPTEESTISPQTNAASFLTALDRYVAAPDTNYSFKLLTSARCPGGVIHILEMTSQAWLTTNEVNHPLWKHWLAITCPDRIANTTALLYITGGENTQSRPATPEDVVRRTVGNLVRLAVETQSVVAELHDVPNQPLIFENDGHPRSEDDLIAYATDKFLRTGDARWVARLPMTKSAVRAMDTITAFCATPEGGSAQIRHYFVAGASKRGWTTWTTAAVDRRVVAIAPTVIDVLNVEPSMRHHYAAYGFWAPAIHNYTEFHIMDWLGTPQFKALLKIEDPYTYRARLTMPKLILNDTGDQFFLPDSSRFYFADLPGEKYLRYVPNTDHSMKGSDAWETLDAFYQCILAGTPRPRFAWTFEGNNEIKVRATDTPREVKLWQATNPDARDFRLETLGPKWTSRPLAIENGVCVARVPEPARGWTAFMVELTYDTPGGKPLKLTTSVRVVPDKLNFKFVPQSPLTERRHL